MLDIRHKDGKLTRTYRKWSSMIQRCENPKHIAYAHYGGTGVRVCERWHSFEHFHSDMGEAPDGKWLDRKDNSKGYEPDNCRWVTPKESAANRGPTGKAIDPGSLMQKAKRAGMPYHLVYDRVKLCGWSEADALTKPKVPYGRRHLGSVGSDIVGPS